MNKDHYGRPITEDEPLNKVIKVWEITPHVDTSYDTLVEREYQKAVEAAKCVVEHLMDEPFEGCLEIKIRLIEMTLEDYYGFVEEE